MKSKFSEAEIKAAKETRHNILQENIPEINAIYMAGEICMWDELRSQPLPEGTIWIEKDAVKEPPERDQECKSISITVPTILPSGAMEQCYFDFDMGKWYLRSGSSQVNVVSYLTPTTLPERFTEEGFIDWCMNNNYKQFADNFQDVHKQFIQSLSKK